MQRRSFRAFSLFLILTVLFTVPVCSDAAVWSSIGKHCGEHLTWSLDDEGLLTISGTGEMYPYADEHAPWNYFDVKNVILEDGVTGIGDGAFRDCYFLKSIRIPESIARIGDYAFFRCYRLKSISLPDGLREIGANPFVFCTALTEIILSPDHPLLSFKDGMLSSKPDHRLVCRLQAEPSDQCEIPEGTQIIGDSAFADCENLRFLTMPEGVSVIGSRAFSGCTILVIQNYPQSLVSVGDYAFSGCRSLGSVRFQEGLTSIGDCAFTGCWYLRCVDLPDTLVRLGNHPFDDCRCLSEFRLSENHPLLGVKDGVLYSKPDGKMIFYLAKNPAETFTVPEEIAVIGERAFSEASSLKRIILPGSVREIESEAFRDCGNVEEITFSEGLKVLGPNAFYDMTGLREVLLPEGLVSIGDQAFAGCSALEKVQIPASVESIGKDCFQGADTLNLAVFVAEGSPGEAYCRQNHLLAVYPGQEIPDPEVQLPPAFTEHFPGYKGVAELFAWTEEEKGEAVYLAKNPAGTPVLLCGAFEGEKGWSVIESTPLPDESRVILSDGLVLLDLGFARCAVRRYDGDTWGIDYNGWRDVYAGPHWIGYFFPTTLYFGMHSWGDLTSIDWQTVTEDFREALRLLDVYAVAVTRAEDPDTRIPIYAEPDSDSETLADLMAGVPLMILDQDGDWTRVSIGQDADNRWKLDGWIPSADLLFPEKADIDRPFRGDAFLSPVKDRTVTLVTPMGSETVRGFNDSRDTWLLIGEMTDGEQEYWLFYECYTEQVGFIPKEELQEPNG